MAESILEIKDLSIAFRDPESGKRFEAVKGISFSIERGSFTSLVGESGSGKSVTALSVCGLLRSADITGKIIYSVGGQRKILSELKEKDYLTVRGKEIAYIFQDPASSLNPVMRAGDQLREVCGDSARAREALAAARIKDVERVYRSFPHELSGGLKQRVMIAMALASGPKLLIADEPTTALDVTTQGQILELLVSLQKTAKLTILFITHDLSLAAAYGNTIYVMEKGRLVDRKSPYAEKLFRASLFGIKPKTPIEV